MILGGHQLVSTVVISRMLLSWLSNPNKAERDQLYKAGVNPVVAFPGQGIVLFGDKTALNKPSAFDRIKCSSSIHCS